MFLPSLECAKITITLLDKYKDGETFEDALKQDFCYSSPEEFLEKYFAQNDYSEELQDEVAELFFRICKYKKYLSMVEKGILFGGPDEISTNLVFLYLFIIELNEVSKNQILQLATSISEKKTSSILFLFKKSEIVTKLYELGCQIWDVEYVNEILKNHLDKPLLQEEYETITSNERKNIKNQKKKLTVPIGPKCMYYPKKFVPPPEIDLDPNLFQSSSPTRIPIMIRPNPIPSSTYEKPIQLEEIEKARIKHREEAQIKYLQAQKNAFRCANPEKSERFRKLAEKIEKERFGIPVNKTSRIKIKPKQVQYPKKTAAVILREGARLLKLEQEEIKRFEDLACGGFNNDLIAEWEKEIREETFRKHIEDIEKKHLEGLLSYEEALIAKQKCLKQKKEKAAEFRKEKENWLNQLEMWRKEEQIRIQESFERGKAYEKGAKEAVEHVKEEKHKLALETMEESRALKEKWLKEKEEDLQRKMQLIKEIKALQALGVVKKKQIDFTESGNFGFLYEMSLAELKERLFILKIEVQEELERRRAKVKMKRENRKEIVDSYQDLIESHKKIMQELKQKPDVEDEIKNRTKLTRSTSFLESLRRKLYEKRSERLKQQIMC